MRGFRKFVTSGVGFSFVAVGLTGVFFKFFFKTHSLVEIHAWLGLAMVAAAGIHIFQNWSSLRNHFRDRRVFALLIPVASVILLIVLSPQEPRVSPGEVMDKLTQARMDQIAGIFGKDVSTVVTAMKSDGLQTGTSDETLRELAHRNRKPSGALLRYFVSEGPDR